MENVPKFKVVERPCSVCSSVSRKHVGWRGGSAHHDGQGERVEIVRCTDCTHLYPHPMPVPRDDIAALYTDADKYFSDHDVDIKKCQAAEMLKVIETKIGFKGNVLDVGCGRGEFLWAAQHDGWQAEGVDPSPAYLEWGQANLGVAGLLGRLEDTKFPGEHFDVVRMAGVLEHLYDPFPTLCEVWRVLKPGGVFYLDAPNEDCLYTRVGNFYQRAQGRDWVVNLAPTFAPYHVQGFNRKSIQRLVKRVNFDVESLQVFGKMWPLTGELTLRRRVEGWAGQLVNWFGNQCGAGIYMYLWTRKPPAEVVSVRTA